MNRRTTLFGVLVVSAAGILAAACAVPQSPSGQAQPASTAAPANAPSAAPTTPAPTAAPTQAPAVAPATPQAPPAQAPSVTATPVSPGGAPGYGPGSGPGMGPGGQSGPGAGPGYGPGPGPGYGPGMGPGGYPGAGPGSYPGGGMGPGMMGPGGRSYNQNGSALTMDQAVQIANQYLASAGNSDLQLASVHQYSNDFEAEYAEKSTGIHAFEVMIDPYSGAAYPEMGPNVMWNTKYGNMGGMFGGPGSGDATTQMPVSADAAKQNAQKWLDANMQGATLGSDVDTAYGYYEMMVQKDGKEYGQIDVNGYSGQVWYENWHGTFVDSREIKSGG